MSSSRDLEGNILRLRSLFKKHKQQPTDPPSFSDLSKQGAQISSLPAVSRSSVQRNKALEFEQPALAQIPNQHVFSGPQSESRTQSVLEVIGRGAIEGLRVIKDSSDWFPQLKAVAAGILAIVDLVEKYQLNMKDAHSFSSQLQFISAYLQRTSTTQIASDEQVKERIERLNQLVHNKLQDVLDFLQRPTVSRIATATQDQKEMASSSLDLSSFLINFIVETTLSTEDKTIQLLSLATLESLRSSLNPVRNAAHHQDGPVPRRTCTPETRQDILQTIYEWACDPSSKRIYCLVGMAGTGKTTIAKTVCQFLEKTEHLGASFFCSRADQQTSDEKRIAPTIAFQLAQRFPDFTQQLHKTLQTAGIIHSFSELVLAPFEKATIQPSKPIVIVIDALDETKLLSNGTGFLRDLRIITAECPFPLKVFMTFRPEIPFRGMKDDLNPSWTILQDVEESLIQADIRLFIEERLQAIVEERKKLHFDVPPGWPSSEQVTALVEQSGRLFIYAATACEYIRGNCKGSPLRRLQHIVGSHPETSTLGIDDLYRNILHAALDDLDPEDRDETWTILRLVIVSAEPLNAETMAALTGMDTPTVHERLAPLHSVVHILGKDDPISTFHASFPDFITNRSRADSHFLCPRTANLLVANSCFGIMKTSLRQNLCKLDIKSRGRIPNAEIEEGVAASSISDALLYSCRHWVYHCYCAGRYDQDSFEAQLFLFFTAQNLPWIECLSLKGFVLEGISVMQRLEQWIPSAEIEIRSFARDTRRFIALNAEILRTHALETYFCAVAWLPLKSHIRQTHLQKAFHPNITQGLFSQWDACDLMLPHPKLNQSIGNLVLSVVFSPDSTQVVSGSSDKTVRLWNAVTGLLEIQLRGHTDKVRSVAFSPDGIRVVSGSDDQSVRVWNLITAGLEIELIGHSGAVNSVVFSPDGTRVASGSNDLTIRVWNAVTGAVEVELIGHSGAVNSIAFSNNGTRLVSGSCDQTVCVWDLVTGALAIRLTGHSGSVNSVAFSPDGTRVVSGSDDGVQVWITHTGAPDVKLAGNLHMANSVAFSFDGTRVAAGANDRTVHIWNVVTGAVEFQLKGHSHRIRSVSFSPDGTRVVSGSDDDSARVWNITMGALDIERTCHSGWVNAVAFSSDGTRVVSGSDDQNIRVWNAATGSLELELTGHSNRVSSVAFSPTSASIASGSYDKTVRIWNAATGALVAELAGHSDNVTSVAFSPDGKLIMSQDVQGHSSIWDAATGEKVTHLLAPYEATYLPSSEVFVDSDGSWLCTAPAGRRSLWIPPRYTPWSMAFSGRSAAFGMRSGQVIIIHLSDS